MSEELSPTLSPTLKSVESRTVVSRKFLATRRELDLKIASLYDQVEQENDLSKKKELELDLKIAMSERELFFWEHDTTGAKKSELFGQDLNTLLKDQNLTFTKDRGIECDNCNSLDKMSLVMVNMGELDRFNESGDHGLGDVALEETFKHIDTLVLKILKEYFNDKLESGEIGADDLLDYFTIYRVSGNDFAVRLFGLDSSVVEQITNQLNQSIFLDSSFKDANKYFKEPVPLSANFVSFEKNKRLLETVFTLLNKNEASFDSKDRGRVIAVLREGLQVFNNFEKFSSRLDRIVEKIKKEEASGLQEGEISSQELYDKFLKKSLGTLFASKKGGAQSFDEFKNSLSEKGAFNDTDSWGDERFVVSAKKALDIYDENFKEKHEVKQELRDVVLEEMKKTYKKHTQNDVFTGFLKNTTSDSELNNSEFSEKDRDAFSSFQDFVANEQSLYSVGLNRMKELDDLVALAEQNGNEKEIYLAKLKRDIELRQRDQSTGLYKRGKQFSKIESLIKKGKTVSVVAIDMAFLKYFDKEGGSRVGDLAIQCTGIALEKVKKILKNHPIYSDLDLEVYRVGGDEFSVVVDTDDSNALRFIISTLTSEASVRIPRSENSSVNYQPQNIEVNCGLSSFVKGTGLFASKILEDSKKSIRIRENRTHESDTLIQMADELIKVDKTKKRFLKLISSFVLAGKEQANIGALNSLLDYSEKTIFGKKGRDFIKQMVDSLNQSDMRFDFVKVLNDFVINNVRDEYNIQLDADLAEHFLTRLNYKMLFVSLHAQKLQERLDSLQEADEKNRELVAELREQISLLKNQLELLKQEDLAN